MMVLFQQGLQLRVVLMAVADTFCSRQADAVYQAGVYQFVGKYQGVCVCHGWQNACIQVITAGEDQCPVPSEQAGKHLSSSSWTGKLPVSKREEEAESKKSRSERPFMNSSRSDKSEARPDNRWMTSSTCRYRFVSSICPGARLVAGFASCLNVARLRACRYMFCPVFPYSVCGLLRFIMTAFVRRVFLLRFSRVRLSVLPVPPSG